MKIRFECRDDACPALIEYRPLGTGDEPLACPRCQRQYTIRGTKSLSEGCALKHCALCGGAECFVRKNFPQKLGLAIVLVAAAISFLSLQDNISLAYGVLASAVVLDLLIYYCIGVVTVCYRCRAEYWGLTRNDKHDWFDLAVSEKYS